MDDFIQIKNLGKRFRNTEVLKNVNMNIKKGEIHGLVGANGSGKSTLLNILFGKSVISETGGYSGEIVVDGISTKIDSTDKAVKAGIGMVHQEFVLIGDMDVSENININDENVYRFSKKIFGDNYAYIDKKENQRAAEEILDKLGIELDTKIKVINLSTNMKQFVEIAREVKKTNLKLLLLDEPTAVLNKKDSKKLIEVLREVAKLGTSIIYVSHRLEEITDLCDNVTVLRDGEVVSQYHKKHFNNIKIAEDMIGYKVVKTMKEKSMSTNKNIMEFKDFSVNMPGEFVKNINLHVKEGEILGITGLSGHGKLGIPYGIMGMYGVSGDVIYNGHRIETDNICDTIDKGIYVIPDERRTLGLLLDHSIEDNITFNAIHNRNKFLKKFILQSLSTIKKEESSKYAESCIQEYGIKCESMNQNVRELSGGNQQKVCIARALSVEPKIIFISEPTRGIDINAKEKILEIIVDTNLNKNTTMVICSSELDELKRVCDRIAVMYEGRIFDILSPNCSDKEFSLAFSGERREKHD